MPEPEYQSVPGDERLHVGDIVCRLTVVGFKSTPHKKHGLTWEVVCNCSCGNTNVSVPFKVLVRQRIRSCGCAPRRKKNNALYTPEYVSWHGMMKRCYETKAVNYARYGGRGIYVCDKWRYSFEAFLADMGKKPTPAHSLDRYPNNNGNYEPNNCRWATLKEQANNKRNSRWITIGEETRTLAQWCELRELNSKIISGRLSDGWSEEEAITIPIRRRPKKNGNAPQRLTGVPGSIRQPQS